MLQPFSTLASIAVPPADSLRVPPTPMPSATPSACTMALPASTWPPIAVPPETLSIPPELTTVEIAMPATTLFRPVEGGCHERCAARPHVLSGVGDELTAHRGPAAENSLDRERAEYGRVFGFSAGEYILAAEDDSGAQVGCPGEHILHGLQALNVGSDRRAARRKIEDTAKRPSRGRRRRLPRSRCRR